MFKLSRMSLRRKFNNGSRLDCNIQQKRNSHFAITNISAKNLLFHQFYPWNYPFNFCKFGICTPEVLIQLGLAEKVSPALQQQKNKVDKKLEISNIFKDEKVPPPLLTIESRKEADSKFKSVYHPSLPAVI